MRIRMDRAVLPELHASTDVVGAVTADVAEEVGLAAGTPVVIGGGDGCCAATGAGRRTRGAAPTTTSARRRGSRSPRKRPSWISTMRTFTWAHLVPGMFSPCGTMQAAGGSYQWLRDNLCQPEKDAAAGGRTSAPTS